MGRTVRFEGKGGTSQGGENPFPPFVRASWGICQFWIWTFGKTCEQWGFHSREKNRVTWNLHGLDFLAGRFKFWPAVNFQNNERLAKETGKKQRLWHFQLWVGLILCRAPPHATTIGTLTIPVKAGGTRFVFKGDQKIWQLEFNSSPGHLFPRSTYAKMIKDGMCTVWTSKRWVAVWFALLLSLRLPMEAPLAEVPLWSQGWMSLGHGKQPLQENWKEVALFCQSGVFCARLGGPFDMQVRQMHSKTEPNLNWTVIGVSHSSELLLRLSNWKIDMTTPIKIHFESVWKRYTRVQLPHPWFK